MGAVHDALYNVCTNDNLTYEERDRLSRKDINVEGMQKYASCIHVGDYVSVVHKRGYAYRGWVESIKDDSLSIYTIEDGGYRSELIEVEGVFLASAVTKFKSYAEMLNAKLRELRRKCDVGMTIHVYCLNRSYKGVFKEIRDETLIMELCNKGGTVCVPVLAISDICLYGTEFVHGLPE